MVANERGHLRREAVTPERPKMFNVASNRKGVCFHTKNELQGVYKDL